MSVAVETSKPVQESKELTVGIDLGTSNTCASAVIGGRPQVLPTRYGTHTIPSVLTLAEDGSIIVGEAARRRMILRAAYTVYCSKRLIGRTYREDTAEAYQPHFAYPIVESDEGRFAALLKGRIISMEEVACHLLKEVRQVAEAHLGTQVHRAVITVPAYFGEAQRNAVRLAGEKAGLKVARILNEPTAAAVAYGYRRAEEGRLAVFDLGGGTFDISILEMRRNTFEVIGTGGDCFIGGIDFDNLLVTYLLERFCKATGCRIEPSDQQLARLREAAENAKRELSIQQRVVVSLTQFAEVGDQMRDLQITLERATLDELSKPLVNRIMEICAKVFSDARIEPGTMRGVLLVGGATRMPMIQARVEDFFAQKPSRRVNPDEAVALGAALLASEPSEPVTLVDVLPLSIGIAREGRRFTRLILRNTPVPTEKKFSLSTTKDNQRILRLYLFQGEHGDAVKNEYLGTMLLEDIPPGPAGSHKYELTLRFDEQCKLSMTARDLQTDRMCNVRLDRRWNLSDVIERLGPYRAAEETQQPIVAPTRSGWERFLDWMSGLLGR